MTDMKSSSTKQKKTLKPKFPSGNIDPREVFKACYMLCDELFFRANHVLIGVWHLKP